MISPGCVRPGRWRGRSSCGRSDTATLCTSCLRWRVTSPLGAVRLMCSARPSRRARCRGPPSLGHWKSSTIWNRRSAVCTAALSATSDSMATLTWRSRSARPSLQTGSPVCRRVRDWLPTLIRRPSTRNPGIRRRHRCVRSPSPMLCRGWADCCVLWVCSVVGVAVTGARLRFMTLSGCLVAALLVLLAWSQSWYQLVLAPGSGATGAPLSISGDIASPALAAFALAALALVAALALAGPGIRMVLGVLAVLLGGCVLLAAATTLSNPVTAVSSAVTKATGVAGDASTAALIGSLTQTGWPIVSFIGGVLLLAAGGAALITGGRWPGGSRRYSPVRMAPVDGPDQIGESVDSMRPIGANRSGGAAVLIEASDGVTELDGSHESSSDAISDWDSLTHGTDPTVRN